MRRASYDENSVRAGNKRASDWKVIANLLPYLWAFKWRVGLALTCLIAAKVDRKSTRLNSSHSQQSRMPSSA